MPKQLKPVWRLDIAERADSGGKLYNAFHNATAREYYGCPSYDRDAMVRRVETLNRESVKLYRGRPANPYHVLDAIFRMLDGREWNSQTLDDISALLTSNGYIIRDPNEVDDDAE